MPCGGGYGPSYFDMVMAITSWVEHGTAPGKIMAIKYSNDNEQRPGASTGEIKSKSKSGVDTNVTQSNVSRANGTN